MDFIIYIAIIILTKITKSFLKNNNSIIILLLKNIAV